MMFRLKYISRTWIAGLLSLTFPLAALAQHDAIPLRPIDQKRVAEIAGILTDQPSGFGEPISNRQKWDQLRNSGGYDAFLKEMQTFTFPEFGKADYFSLSDGSATSSGKGLTMMRNRAKGLSMVTIAECLENNGKYLKQTEAGLRDIIQQKSWVSPRIDYDFINYNGKQYTIDLTSALYAHTIAQTLFLLGDKLNPELRKEAVQALYIRVFDPLKRIFEKQDIQYHNWLVGTNNWNAVCLSGVIGAALTVIPDKKERAFYAWVGEEYSKNTLAGFGDDGYCSEGVTYFNYGFGHYAMLRENLWQATRGQIDLFKIPKVREIAQYIPKLEVINGVFPAISDSKTGSAPDSSLMNYLSRSLNLGFSAYENIKLTGRVSNNRMDVFMVFPNSNDAAGSSKKALSKKESPLRSFFDKSGILVVRPKSATALAAVLKGGNNAEHHNHNDVGSYSVVLGKDILAGDPGSIPYTANIFDPEFRYTYKSNASYGHPVPLVAGQQQKVGPEAQAKVMRSDFSDQQDILVLDLASAYDAPTLSKLERHFAYNRTGSGSLSVEDVFEFSQPENFQTACITRAKITATSPGKWLLAIGDRQATLTMDTGGLKYDVTQEEISEGGTPYTRLAIVLKDKNKKGKVTLTYQP
ncbi:heparinase II/III family protein [Dyadobacter sp. CY323]|uniref:heparinase II/III domain-containing protein n=1 Tax=Dyadobacter sp. CY323 TaxID=2907302 RepID=UPI001F30D6F1|nr:heparinase II/III family protein [Dyadobacter sp. CY323]MCE6991088.1 heparinase II/III-family protein [Dyadobacter sp. CY323]